MYSRDGHRCRHCGTTDDLTLDHVTPLAVAVASSYSDDEFVTLCRTCNSRRGACAVVR